MKVLVIGGTRLLGLALVRRLLALGHQVTLISRRHASAVDGLTCVLAERAEGLRRIAEDEFDAVFDFLAYDFSGADEALRLTGSAPYFLVSSTWVARMRDEESAASPIVHPSAERLERLLPVTRNYLIGKIAAERATHARRAEGGRKTSILRMPIFWGVHDHTGRVAFYAERIRDGNPVILVDGGRNLTQIAWVEDIAGAIAGNMSLLLESERPIWECLPHVGCEARDVVRDIASGVGREAIIIDVSETVLRKRLLDYLDIEPLWRENALHVTDSNLFRVSGVKPTPQSAWLARCATEQEHLDMRDIRGRELKLIKDLH